MGLTYSECKALGIEHLYPKRTESLEDTLRRHGAEVPVVKSQALDDEYDSKLERAFGKVLEQAEKTDWVTRWWLKPLKLRLAGRTFYSPDFLVMLPWREHFQLCVCETKGYMREDASVKLKVAAEKYPCFIWYLIQREGRHGWDVREVGRNGIGTSPIQVPWITGG